MQANRSVDTGPELMLRRLLFRRGLRYRKHRVIPAGDQRIKPDIAFISARVAVFVDGCFWHGCKEHRSVPKTNREFWDRKFAANQERDRRQTTALHEEGWQVVRCWEHDVPSVADSIASFVELRRDRRELGVEAGLRGREGVPDVSRRSGIRD
jgi:DNA mismatch endonuclease Vsr